MTAPEPEPDRLEALLERVAREPGVTLGALAGEGTDIGLVKWAIAHGRLYLELGRDVIDDPEHAPVYPNREVALALATRTPPSWAIGGEPPESLAVEPGARLRWGDTDTEIAAVANGRVWLVTGPGRTVELARDDVEAFWRSGSMRPLPGAGADLAKISRDVALERYRAGGRQGLEIALRRLEIVEAYGRAKTDPADPHWTTDPKGRRRFGGVGVATVEGWIRERRRVAATCGDALAGLVPAANPGNRTVRLDQRVETILAEVALELYASPDRRTIRSVVGEVRRRARAAGLVPPHPRTVRERLKRLPIHETARARLGDPAAYRLEPFSPIEPDAPPPNGAYPTQVLHADHTLADQETIDPESGEPIGRLYLSRAFDGFTGRECAHLWSYDPPDAGTILRLLVRYAERFGRLPEVIILDKDPAHRSLELLAFCEAFGITIVWRRTRRGRDGWRVERPFGTLNQDLLYALGGNTQASRNPRQLTKENDPKLRSVWDLVELDRRYREVRDARDERFDPLLGTSPREAWENGLRLAGVGRLVRVDERLRFLAMPYADGVTRAIHPSKGVVVGYLRYEAPEFAEPDIAYREAEVRVDPDDASRVVALVAGRVIVARCRAIAHFRVISRTELALLSERIRRDERLAGRLQARFETRLAEILASARDWERTQTALRAKALRAAEASARDAADGTTEPTAATTDPTEPSAEPEPDASPYWERRWGDADATEKEAS